MPHPLTQVDTFSYDILNKELQLTSKERLVVETFLKAYNDDFWQKGKGSLLPPATGTNSSVINAAIEKRFVFRNIIRECAARVAGAFFGKAPNWKFQLNGKPIEKELGEVEKALSDLWTRQRLAQELAKAFESRLVFGRGGLRIFLPAKFKKQNTETRPGEGGKTEEFTKFKDITEAIRAMRVEFISPTQARQLDDEGGLISLVTYGIRKDWATQEIVNVIEFSFVDDSEQTFIGTVEERSSTTNIENANLSSPFDLAGATTYNEFQGDPYITQALYKNNQLANLALTCAGFSLVDNGFGEMILTNVELETDTVPNPDGDGTIEVPKRIKRGGGVSQNFVGMEQEDPNTGVVTRTTPGVTFKDPSPLTAFKDGFDLAYAACLQEANQLYALISGDATASGESRIQALADFALRITPYKPEIDEQGSWALTTILLWAAALAEDTSFVNHRIVYDCRVHIANLSDAERQVVMKMRQDGVISRETERVLLGVDDPALEAELVLKEQAVPIKETTTAQFSERLDVGLKMMSLGIDAATIQKYLGYTDAEITEMQRIAAEREAELLASMEDDTGTAGAGDTAAATA